MEGGVMGKRERLAEELARAKERRAVLDRKIEALSKSLTETENAEILGVVRSYDLSPEELEELISQMTKGDKGTKKEESNS